MKRRNFMAASLAAGALPLGLSASAAEKNEGKQKEYIELRHYHLHVGEKEGLVADFFEQVAIPALNRIGVKPVGVFHVKYGPNQPSLYVLIPHKSLASVAEVIKRLLDNKDFKKDGADFLDRPLSDPAYVRMESWLMEAFDEMPRVEPPQNLMDKRGRIYELRTYESHSVKAGKKKVEMFNEGGEIALFRKTGLQPVFFGETIVGPRMPNLTYMLVFESMAARDERWRTFIQHPEWKELSGDPQYKDTVSNISDFILSPAPFSQV